MTNWMPRKKGERKCSGWNPALRTAFNVFFLFNLWLPKHVGRTNTSDTELISLLSIVAPIYKILHIRPTIFTYKTHNCPAHIWSYVQRVLMPVLTLSSLSELFLLTWYYNILCPNPNSLFCLCPLWRARVWITFSS